MSTVLNIKTSRLYLFALSGECVLNYKTGLINRAGSPFSQMRKLLGKDEKGKNMLPQDKAQALVFLYHLWNDNAEQLGEMPKTLKDLAGKWIADGVIDESSKSKKA